MIAAVTGGAGFIGRHLVKRLLEAGNYVKVLTRSPDNTPGWWLNKKLELCKGDLTVNMPELKAFLDGAQILYHCAGEIRDHVVAAFPDAKIAFRPDPPRAAIVDSWPGDVDDEPARHDWGWHPDYDAGRAFSEYLVPGIKRLYGDRAPA